MSTPVAPTSVSKYGLNFPTDSYDTLKIEMWFIRKGGSWADPKTRQVYGNGLSFHYEAMRKLLWPHLDDHRWHRLCRDEILKNKCTVLMGCASSGKTHEASWLYLCEYFCFPDDTLVLVSSTDMRGLRLRVWGEITDLWQQALDKYPYLAGHLIDSRISITTDSLEDKEVDESRRFRDMRKGLAGIPTVQGNKNVGLGKWCFPAGQIVNTPEGGRRIESIRVGDFVLSAVGPSRVAQTFCRTADFLVRVRLNDGRFIDCTPDHPFLTGRGWIKAVDLTTFDRVFSAHETMCLMREAHWKRIPKSEVLFCNMPDAGASNKLRTLQKEISSGKAQKKLRAKILRRCLCKPMGSNSGQLRAANNKKLRTLRQENDRASKSSILLLDSQKAEIGHEAVEDFEKAWVDSVEVLESSGDERYCQREGGYRVYDLQIEGHPSFSVNGVVVHNCGIKQKRVRLIGDELQLMGPAFLSSFSNLNNNADFRAVLLGNPVDITDQLGIASEPVDGWGTTQMEATKTSVWDTKFYGGRCVNLIGVDSPNFDVAGPARYKYMISRDKIAETLSSFAKDSPEYYSQCVGSMKISMIARRIITRQMCYENNALEPVVWKGEDRIRIGSLDAAYGGDRCMFGWGEFGLDVNDNQLLCVYEPEVVPIIVGKEDPEDQIARFVKHRCQNLNIDPSNFFHDSTGRGTLGTVLGRHWSTACNPVEFGGKPTTRPVSLDFFITDEETGQRRLKLSNEHYYNFVTELWFAVRYTIESKQLRNLSKEVLDEGSKREWDYVPRGGSKVIQAEPKEEMKLRTRQSPDMFDCLVILVEGARRRGFQIKRLAKESKEEADSNWLDEQANEEDKILRDALLTH